MAEFEMHAPADILEFEHRPSPSGTGNGDLHRVRTELRMARDESVTSTKENGRVDVVKGLDFENCRRWQIVKKNPAFDFGLDDGSVDVISQVGVRREHKGTNVPRSVPQIGCSGGRNRPNVRTLEHARAVR